MAQENAVAIQLSEEEQQQCQQALQTLNSILSPKLISLSPEQRKQIPKMNDKTVPFVEKTLDYATSNPDFTPAYIDIPNLKIDLDAVGTLTALKRPLEQLLSTLSDSIMLSGSEAYVAGLAYYNSVKQAAKMNVPGAKDIYNDLKKRFETGGR